MGDVVEPPPPLDRKRKRDVLEREEEDLTAKNSSTTTTTTTTTPFDALLSSGLFHGRILPYLNHEDRVALSVQSRTVKRQVEAYSRGVLSLIREKHGADEAFLERLCALLKIDPEQIANASDGLPQRCLLWAALRTYLYCLTVPEGPAVFSFALSREGDRVAISGNRAIQIWDLSSKQQMQTIPRRIRNLSSWYIEHFEQIFFYPQSTRNSSLLVCSSDANRLSCYVDAWTGDGVLRYSHTIRKSSTYPYSCKFIAVEHGDQLLVLGRDQVLHFVDAEVGTETRSNKLQFSAIDSLLVQDLIQLIRMFVFEDFLLVHTVAGLYTFGLTDCSRKQFLAIQYDVVAQCSDRPCMFRGFNRERGTIDSMMFTSSGRSVDCSVRGLAFAHILSAASLKWSIFVHELGSQNVIVCNTKTADQERILNLSCGDQVSASATVVSKARNELVVATHSSETTSLPAQNRVVAFCLSEPRSS